jgi:hypothetical protein
LALERLSLNYLILRLQKNCRAWSGRVVCLALSVAAAPAHAGILSPTTDVVAVVDQVHITVVVAGPPAAAAGGGDLSDATPEAPGTPAAGTAVVASRGDHVHAPPTAGQIGAVTSGEVDAAIAAASLDGSQIQSGTVPDAHIPSSIARDSEVSAAVSAHAVAVDPHGDRAHAAGLVDDLSGVTDAATARSNLGLGALATLSSVSSAEIVDGTIVNADIGAGAAIALSKLAVDPLARANHTGTQAQSTVTNLVSDLAGKAAASHSHSAADVGAEPAGVVSDVPQSTFIGAPIAPFTGAVTAATAPGTLLLSPVAHSWTGVARFWWDITATSATSGQTLHLVVYSPGTGGRPGSLLWSQAFDAATVQQATTTTPASVIPNRGWWGVLFPSTLAGNVTMRFGYPVAATASDFHGGYNNFACSFAATSQGSTPASSLSSYTFGSTPAATVLGAVHALRPVCPLIFLRGS